MDIADILIHVDSDLKAATRDELEDNIRRRDGVISVHFSPKHPHLLNVAYDPKVVSSDDLLAFLREHAIRAEKVGL